MKQLVIIVLVSIVVFAACEQYSEEYVYYDHVVYFEVTGTASAVSVEYTEGGARVLETGRAIPYTKTLAEWTDMYEYRMRYNPFTVTSEDVNDTYIIVTLYYDGEIYKQAIANGPGCRIQM